MFVNLVALLIVVYVLLNVLFKQRIHFIELVALLLGLIFVSSITEAPDVENYLIEYTAKYYVPRDVGFYNYMMFFNKIGLNFYEFKTFHLMLCMIILFFGLKLIVPNIGCVIVLYMLYPFMVDVVQIRNFFVMSLVTLAYAMMLRLKGKILIYVSWILIVLCASSYHIAAIAFLPFVLFYDKDEFLRKMMWCFLFLSVCLVFLSNTFFSSIMINLLTFVDDSSRVDDYMERTSKFGPLYTIMKSLMMIYISQKALYIYEVESKFVILQKNVVSCTNLFRYTKNLFLYSSFFWPLYVWGGSFMRLMRNENVLLYVLVCSSFFLLLQVPNNLKNEYCLNDVFFKMFIVFVVLMFLNIFSILFPLDHIVGCIVSNLNFCYAFNYNGAT